MSEDPGKKPRKGYTSLRQLLIDYPESGQRVIGNGTVHIDPEEIRESENYKDMVEKVRAYFQENDLK